MAKNFEISATEIVCLDCGWSKRLRDLTINVDEITDVDCMSAGLHTITIEAK